MLRFDFRESARDQIEGLIPTGLAKLVAFTDQRRGQTVRVVHVIPSELSLDAGGDSVRGAVRWLDLQDVAVLGPNIEAAADSAIGAHGLGAPDALFAHVRFDLGHAQDGAVSSL